MTITDQIQNPLQDPNVNMTSIIHMTTKIAQSNNTAAAAAQQKTGTTSKLDEIRNRKNKNKGSLLFNGQSSNQQSQQPDNQESLQLLNQMQNK